MPSPIAHALAGVAAGWIVDPPTARDRRAAAQRACLCAVAGMAPDLDLLVGAHSGPTHGLGSALIVGFVVWVCLRTIGWRRPGLTAWAVVLAYASHTLLDWLGSDTSPPIGIMALWPLDRRHYESQRHLFMAISRRYWLPDFWTLNLHAVAREVAILGPLALLVAWRRRRSWQLTADS